MSDPMEGEPHVQGRNAGICQDRLRHGAKSCPGGAQCGGLESLVGKIEVAWTARRAFTRMTWGKPDGED